MWPVPLPDRSTEDSSLTITYQTISYRQECIKSAFGSINTVTEEWTTLSVGDIRHGAALQPHLASQGAALQPHKEPAYTGYSLTRSRPTLATAAQGASLHWLQPHKEPAYTGYSLTRSRLITTQPYLVRAFTTQARAPLG